MSESDLTAEDGESNNITIFQSPFPIPENGKINTWQFLKASKGLVTLLETFGKVFAAVKSDMNGNIVKLTTKYYEDKIRFNFLDDMILSEKDTNEIIATDALLWLSRGLHFLQLFFELFAQNDDNTDETVVPLLKTAYNETLRPYHGWFTQQLFRVIIRVCPTRSQILKNMNSEHTNNDDKLISCKMSEYTVQLKQNVHAIKEFYKEHDLESRIKG